MGWFLLGIALIAAAILLLFSLPQSSVGQLVRLLRGIAIALAAVFGVFGLFTGKLLWGVLGLGAALVIYLMGGTMPWNFKRPEKGTSEVETPVAQAAARPHDRRDHRRRAGRQLCRRPGRNRWIGTIS